jgi:hypothetical protein
MKVLLNNVRLAFPALFEAKQVNGEGEPAFSAAFLLKPGSETAKAVGAAIDAVAKEKFGAKAADMLVQMRKADKTCLHDGDNKPDLDGYAGMLYVSARSKARPLVLGADKSPLTAADGKPYGGCYVNASIDVWAQDNKFGKRINAQLRGVQFVRDGEAFAGGGAASEDEFEAITEGADAGDLT